MIVVSGYASWGALALNRCASGVDLDALVLQKYVPPLGHTIILHDLSPLYVKCGTAVDTQNRYAWKGQEMQQWRNPS